MKSIALLCCMCLLVMPWVFGCKPPQAQQTPPANETQAEQAQPAPAADAHGEQQHSPVEPAQPTLAPGEEHEPPSLSIVAGWYDTCVWTANGRARCWGRSHGVLGTQQSVSQLRVEGHGAILYRDGRLGSWGNTEKGQLGRSLESDEFLPIERLTGIADASFVAIALRTTHVYFADDRCLFWGQRAESSAPRDGCKPYTTVSSMWLSGDDTKLGVFTIPLESHWHRDLVASHEWLFRELGVTIPPLQSNCWLLHGQIGCSSLDEALSISIAQLDPALPPSNVSVGHFVYIEKQGWDGQRYHAEPPYWGRYACAIIADDAEAAKSVLGVRVPGRVACWGSFPEPMLDASGQALSPQQDVLVETRGPTWLPFDGVLELALGPSHMCVVTSDERVLCWGENDYGQLGVEPRPTSSATPLFIPDLDDAVDLAAGEDHACVKRKDGSVWCWGSNEHDQLGRETRWKRWAVPLKNVAFDGDVRQLGVGWDDTCVCYADGRFHCIQHEHYPFTEGEEASPVTFEAQDLSVSGMRLCLIHSDHKLYCAGEYYYGAGIYLSHEDMFSASTRDLIGRLKRVHVGREMDCGIRRDDRVVCWGWVPNLPGAECERPDPSCFVIAKPFASLGRVQSLAVNAATACALTQNDGRVVCWGSNDGFVPETGEMVEIEGLEKVKALSGYVGYCALHEDGGVSCWKLSLGLDGEPFTAPARIAGISDAVQIAVGGAFACARHADGRVSCWGDGEYGQLGIPNRYEVVELPWKTLLDDETKVLQQPAD